MKTRGWLAAVLETRSLKFQILSRTLLVMSALLLLIGVFQYVFMQQFMFQNKAETIRNQLAALPPNVWLRAELGEIRVRVHFCLGRISRETIGRIMSAKVHGFSYRI